MYEIPIELSSLMNVSVSNGPIIALNLTILTTLKTKEIAILNLDKKISKFRCTLNNGEIVYDKKLERLKYLQLFT